MCAVLGVELGVGSGVSDDGAAVSSDREKSLGAISHLGLAFGGLGWCWSARRPHLEVAVDGGAWDREKVGDLLDRSLAAA